MVGYVGRRAAGSRGRRGSPYDPSFDTFEMPDEGGISGPPARGSIRVRVKPNRVRLAVFQASPSSSICSSGRGAAICAARGGPGPAAGPCHLTCSHLRASVSGPRDRLELVKPQMLLEMKKSAIRLSPFCTRAMVWARFRRDSAGDSLEVVHDQRPPTPFHAQNRQFQPPPTTANDTWGVRALLRRLISVVHGNPRIHAWIRGFALLGEARSGRIPQEIPSRCRVMPISQLNHDLGGVLVSQPRGPNRHQPEDRRSTFGRTVGSMASLSSPLPWYPADRRAQWARTPTVGALRRRCGSRPGRA